MSRDSEPRRSGQALRGGYFRQRLQALIGEPLIHFLLIGLLLFAGYAAIGGNRDDRNIKVDDKIVAALSAQFQATWQRPPTAGEVTALVESYVRDEIFYREGLALGLDRDDSQIKRRVRQKFEVLAEETEAATPPTDEEMRAWLASHADRYADPAIVTFNQVLIDPHGATTETALRSVRAALAAGTDPAELGRGSILPPRIVLLPLDLVARDFGDGFAKAIASVRPGRWEGPVRSGYGLHLVSVEKIIPARVPALHQVRPAVARDMESARRRKAIDATYERLRNDYRVELTAAIPPSGAQGR